MATKKKAKKKTTKKTGEKLRESDASRFSRIEKSLPYSIECAYTKLVEVHKLTPHPENPNQHPEKQIIKFADVMKRQGVRRPITVSKLSGYVTCGHGELMAFILNGWEWAPVDFQNYDNPGMEFEVMVADNALGEWSRMDKAKINESIINLGPELSVEMLGFPNFVVDPSEKGPPVPHKSQNPTEEIKFTLTTENANTVRKAIHESSKAIHHDDSTGQDNRGSGLVHICERWLEDHLAE